MDFLGSVSRRCQIKIQPKNFECRFASSVPEIGVAGVAEQKTNKTSPKQKRVAFFVKNGVIQLFVFWEGDGFLMGHTYLPVEKMEVLFLSTCMTCHLYGDGIGDISPNNSNVEMVGLHKKSMWWLGNLSEKMSQNGNIPK